MIVLFLCVLALFAGLVGWSIRGWIADKEHDYRWNVEGCRHNMEERWHE